MLNRKKLIPAILAIAVCALSFTACSQQSAASQASTDSSSQQAQNTNAGGQGQSADQNMVYGKVTAVDGSKITYEIGTLNIPNRQGGSSGASRQGTGSRPQGNSSRGQGSFSGQRGARQGNSSGGARGGFEGGNIASMLTMTGQTATVTISDASVLKKQEVRAPSTSSQSDNSASSGSGSEFRGQQTSSASVSDVKAGDILRITTQKSDGKLLSVLILGSSSAS
jgi:hypothetical protein